MKLAIRYCVFIFLLHPFYGEAQIDLLFSNNHDAVARVNPVAQSSFYILGRKNFRSFDFYYKKQWFGVGLPGHPKAYGINYNDFTKLWGRRPKYSIGGSLTGQKAGAIEQYQGRFRLGMQLIDPVGKSGVVQAKKADLYIGVELGMGTFGLDLTEVDQMVSDDLVLESLINTKKIFYRASAGLFGISPVGAKKESKFVYGFAYNNAFQLGYAGDGIKPLRHLYLNVGYFLHLGESKLSDNYFLELSFLGNMADVTSLRTNKDPVRFSNPLAYQAFARFHFNLNWSNDLLFSFGTGYAKERLQLEVNFITNESFGLGLSWETHTQEDTRDHLGRWNTFEVRGYWRFYRPTR